MLEHLSEFASSLFTGTEFIWAAAGRAAWSAVQQPIKERVLSLVGMGKEDLRRRAFGKAAERAATSTIRRARNPEDTQRVLAALAWKIRER